MSQNQQNPEKFEIQAQNAAQIWEWFQKRGGIAVWDTLDLSDPGVTWTTPLKNAEGGEPNKPHPWKAGKIIRTITDPADCVVITAKEVKRFHVATRMGSQGMRVKVTDGGSRRIRAEVAKASEQHKCSAWYEFDYGDYNNAVILIAGDPMPLLEWAKQYVPPGNS